MKLSQCKHCQTDNSDDTTGNCHGCGYHPWTQCYHPDCGKLPPVKHEPRSTPSSSATSEESAVETRAHQI
ncbi:hypothetical protein F4823DRAFT_595854 [Ustulina deusta]|nr:hypothetical protein F4823DRAFT_595854 [Ustulina deusta]